MSQPYGDPSYPAMPPTYPASSGYASPQGGYPPPQGGYPSPQAGYAVPQGYQAPYAPYGVPSGPQPPDYLGWCVVAIFFFWPLAIAAFIARGKITPAWMMGDQATAWKASRDTRKYGIISLCIGLGWMVLVGILVVVALTSAAAYHVVVR